MKISRYILLITICVLVNMVYSQIIDTIDTVVFSEKPKVREDISNQDTHKVEIKQETQEDLINKNINILTTFATLMSVLVGIITLIVVILAGCGFLEYKRWRNIRKKAEQNAKVIENIRNKVQKDADRLQDEMSKVAPPSLIYEPSENIKEKFSEISRQLEFLELLNINLKPEDYNSRGIDLFFKNKYEDALITFDKALKLDPKYAEAWFNRGVALYKLGRYKDALKALDKALKLDPDYAEAWCNKGVALYKLGRYKDALKALDKALKLDPDYAEAWCNKGIVLDELGRYKDALKAYDKALKLNPDYAKAWCNKGVTLDKLDRYEDALKAYDKALELYPDYAEVWYNKGCLNSSLRNKDEALSCLRKAIDIDPSLKEKAKVDEDFKWLWDDKDFKNIVS